MINDRVYYPRIWEGSMLFHGPLIGRAIDFGIDFSAHKNWAVDESREYWEGLAGGALSFRNYEQMDTMDEFTMYCALVERNGVTYCPRAVHLQGPESLHRNNPELYRGSDDEWLGLMAEGWKDYFCVYAAVAVYFIAGNWENEAEWARIHPNSRPAFEKLIPTAAEWMTPEEYARLEKIVAGFASSEA